MVEKVAAYQFSRRFKKEYTNLPREIQRTFDQKLQLLLQDVSHPSLRVKRIQGTKNQWEGSITMKYASPLNFLKTGFYFEPSAHMTY